MNIVAVNVPPEGEEYIATVYLTTGLVASLETDREVYLPGNTINLKGRVDCNAITPTVTSMQVEITRPDEVKDYLQLYDDGLHGDDSDNDGVYGNAYSYTAIEGIYEIKLIAEGFLPEERLQYVEGFSSAISAPHQWVYNTYRGQATQSYWEYAYQVGTYVDWETAQVPSNYTDGKVTFIWSGANGPLAGTHDLYLNGVKILSFNSGQGTDWTWTAGRGSSELFFDFKNNNADNAGVYYLTVPISSVAPGGKSVLRAEAAVGGGGLDWFMVHDFNDTIEYELSADELNYDHIGTGPITEQFYRETSKNVYVQSLPDMHPVDLALSLGSGPNDVNICATITNNGIEATNDVLVEFYEVNDVNALKIDGGETIDIEPGQTRTVSVAWEPTSGPHEICVVIDPQDTISEENEMNNHLSRTFCIWPGSRGDVDWNCIINFPDFAKLTMHWLETCSESDWCSGTDLDRSREVNFLDIAALAGNWLESGPP